MPALTLTIQSTRSAPEVYQVLAGIPSALSGKKADPSAFRRLFLSQFTTHFLAHITYAFLQKSRGGTDSLQQSWPALTAQTIARKLRKRRTTKPVDPFLTPAQQKKWAALYTSAFNHYRQTGVPKRDIVAASRRAAWQQLTTASPNSVPINIDSGRLLASLQPGTLSGDTYVPSSPDQKYRQTPAGIALTFQVPYASYVHKKRPLYPSMATMRPWTRSSASSALAALFGRLKETIT